MSISLGDALTHEQLDEIRKIGCGASHHKQNGTECDCGCLMFWGSHGCDLAFGHRGVHQCGSKKYGTECYEFDDCLNTMDGVRVDDHGVGNRWVHINTDGKIRDPDPDEDDKFRPYGSGGFTWDERWLVAVKLLGLVKSTYVKLPVTFKETT